MLFAKSKKYLSLFFLCLIVRIIFKLLMPHDNFSLFTDAYRYDELSSRIISGNFDLDFILYTSAPLYPYTLALFKFIFGEAWQYLVVFFQFVLVALSVVYIYRLTYLLFKSDRAALLAGLLYIFYPLTLWYNFTLVQETTFQAYFIFFLYHFLSVLKSTSKKHVYLSALFFGLAVLTKSHILIMAPFLVTILYVNKQIKPALIFAITLFIMTIPHGIVNYKIHGLYTFSSYGNAHLFLLGHSDETYPCLIEPEVAMREFGDAGCDNAIVADTAYVIDGYGKVNQLAIRERNKFRFDYAMDWIKANPNKVIRLKQHGIKRLILPGLV